ncbi:S8 family serine peptidase [Marinobacterium aestuariivivens]|uniref:Fervidolysin-like N-terminal prodomain domain-containing protein n=1 Tax=Marinobacterium aestuariivivens TaxID=1698799 RepID=A0ABW2A5U2_9GAMM
MHHLIALAVFILACVISLADTLAAPPGPPGAVHSSPPPAFAPDRVLVKFKPGSAASEMAGLAKGDRYLRTIPGIDVHVLEVPEGAVKARIALYERNPNVLYAEPDFYRILIEPDEGVDPRMAPVTIIFPTSGG